MLRRHTQMKLNEYSNLYDILVPKDNLLRQMSELSSFTVTLIQ